MIAAMIASLCVSVLLIAVVRSCLALWAHQRSEGGDAAFRPRVWALMIAGLLAATAIVGLFGWRAAVANLPTDHPPLEVQATCIGGIWNFQATGAVLRPQRDLRLRGGRPVLMKLSATDTDTEFFVPGLGLKLTLRAGETGNLAFRPPSPSKVGEAALYRSVCLSHCRGQDAIRPFLVVVEAPRGVLAY